LKEVRRYKKYYLKGTMKEKGSGQKAEGMKGRSNKAEGRRKSKR
jgi:hypothetical protein